MPHAPTTERPNRLVFIETNADPSGHGGNRRSAQIAELLGKVVTPEVLKAPFGGPPARKLRLMARGALAFGAARTLQFHPKSLRNIGACREMAQTVQAGPGTTLVVEFYIRGLEHLMELVQNAGGTVALFPQNLDSLVPDYVDPSSSRCAPEWIQQELACFRNADYVCCISREEQWLLSTFGIDSDFLPYYPVPTVLSALEKVRANRVVNAPNKVLVLGSAINEPTRRGMAALLERQEDLCQAVPDAEIVFAGFGTERLAHLSREPAVKILGSLPWAAIERLMVEAKVAVCYQCGTSGALTRIMELLYAGIPVIANPIAARSYWGQAGVYPVENLDQLVDVLRQPFPGNVPLPVRPFIQEQLVLKSLGIGTTALP